MPFATGLTQAVRIMVFVLAVVAVHSAHAEGQSSRQPSGYAGCGPSGTILYDDHDRTVRNLARLYREGLFAHLDAALDCLLIYPMEFRSGRLGTSAIYWLYRTVLPGPGATDADISLARVWRVERPNSKFAELASLRVVYSGAWNVRGHSYAQDVSSEDMDAFNRRLLVAEKAIRQASEELKATPMWHNLLLATVLDSKLTATDARETLSTALLRWPRYYDFYEVALSRMVPRWGGSWEEVDRFIREQSTVRQHAEGASLYARLYWNVIAGGAQPRETLLSWPMMKLSLDALIERYPDSVHRNVAASFACIYGDRAYSRKIWSQLPVAEVKPRVWIRGTDPDACSAATHGEPSAS